MDTKRRLSAVWFADIVGYTTLSRTDEPAALRLVGVLQDLARATVSAHDGRIVKFIGDAVLAEFTSTDAAVRAAVALQERYDEGARESGHPSQLRVGVHLGEVTPTPDGDLYGDGINTAARLHQEAVPGRVIISEDVWRQLRQRPEFRFAPLGAVELRGITTRVEVYDVLFGTRAALGARQTGAAAGSRRSARGIAAAGAAVAVVAAAGTTVFLSTRPAPAPEPAAPPATSLPAPDAGGSPQTAAPPPHDSASGPATPQRTAPAQTAPAPREATLPPGPPATSGQFAERTAARAMPTADQARDRDAIRHLLERFVEALNAPDAGERIAALGPGAQMMSRFGAAQMRSVFGEGFEAQLGRIEPLATRPDALDIRFIVLARSRPRPQLTPLAFTATIRRDGTAPVFTMLQREAPPRGRGRSGGAASASRRDGSTPGRS